MQKINFFQAIYYCLLAIFNPNKLDNKNKEYKEHQTQKSSARIVNHAFWTSFTLIISFGLIGFLVGCTLRYFLGVPHQVTILILQSIGALLLLWGTLFIRGFEIQTWNGNTPVERVNQWLYRTMYCIGTLIIILSIFWNYS